LKVPNVLVVGGGPAGYVASIKDAQVGGRDDAYRKNGIGGTKVLLERARLYNKLRNLDASNPRIDFSNDKTQ
jgi:pyruvate/2-oxoglutarate dehydrogenase complex dihydrolipoamide dehydrogenase (E3) component